MTAKERLVEIIENRVMDVYEIGKTVKVGDISNDILKEFVRREDMCDYCKNQDCLQCKENG